MDNNALEDLLKTPGRLDWVPFSSLSSGTHIVCIDGRHTRRTIGAPGGTMGEFILLLAVTEFFTEQAMSYARVHRLFESYLATFGSFYKHTDAKALASLATSAALPQDKIAEIVRDPPEALRETLIERLIEPTHIGCGHLRLLFDHNGPYRVREVLIQHTLRAFFEHLWTGNKNVHFEILEGAHCEQALMVFHSRAPMTDEEVIPVWNPTSEDPSLFSYHLAALRCLRRKLLTWLLSTDELPALSACEELTVLLEIERLAERHLTITSSKLAPTLPRHRVIFDQNKRIEVPD